MRETSTHAHFSSRIVQKRATKYLGPLIPGATAYMCQCVRVRMCVRDLQSRPYYGVVRNGPGRQENRGRAGLHTPARTHTHAAHAPGRAQDQNVCVCAHTPHTRTGARRIKICLDARARVRTASKFVVCAFVEISYI